MHTQNANDQNHQGDSIVQRGEIRRDQCDRRHAEPQFGKDMQDPFLTGREEWKLVVLSTSQQVCCQGKFKGNKEQVGVLRWHAQQKPEPSIVAGRCVLLLNL